MYLKKIFNSNYFIYGLGLGIIIVLLFKPKPKVLIQYPTPYNSGKTIFKDSLNQCFKFKAIRTKCSKENKVISPQI
jgi:hypothetical protein